MSVAFGPDEATAAHEPLPQLLHDLSTDHRGLSPREAARRLEVHGPNALPAARPPSWARLLGEQLTHPLALLLWLAAGLALSIRSVALGVTVVCVVLLNALFAVAQERQAQHAVDALASFVPARAAVLRGGSRLLVPVSDVVHGDVLVVEEGERVAADARLLAGSVDVDMSTLTGESAPVTRSAGVARDDGGPLLQQTDMVFSGTLCTRGSAHAVVVATGARTELGRIAALTTRARTPSPLELQVRRVAWLIAVVAVGAGIAFVPLGLLAGLSLRQAGLFAIGLLVANVPEGLLPTITLALAVGVRSLAREGAVVKRLSAVETLGCTTVICTDKTGTLTENRMRASRLWTPGAGTVPADSSLAQPLGALVRAAALCSALEPGEREGADPTELALASLADDHLGGWADEPVVRVFAFDPRLRTMSVAVGGELLTKGAPESVLQRCSSSEVIAAARRAVDAMAHDGLRVLAVGRRPLPDDLSDRETAEQDLELVGLVGLHDPPREGVQEAVSDCHRAGITVHVVTGDHPLTAGYVARAAGIGKGGLRVVDASDAATLDDAALDELLAEDGEIVFARSAPEAKLRITDALQSMGQVVAMTGDGVNDAPALSRADIGVAMGRSGTDVAREAAHMILTDDHFATLPKAVAAGRRVFDDVRKFVLYIFAHAVPEVLPFLVFALSGGTVPLPLTVLQVLAIDLGTETLPALALGREPAEPGVMDRPPRPRSEGVVTRAMLVRAWLFLGVISAVLVMGGFFFSLWESGWSPGAQVGTGSALHHAYVRATTVTFVGIVSCQVGTAFAARTSHASLREVGLLSNPLLLWGIAFELAFTAAVVLLPPLQSVFGTTGITWRELLVVSSFGPLVWAADEVRRARRRRSA